MTMPPGPRKRRHLNAGERRVIAQARELAALDEYALCTYLRKPAYLVYPVAFARAARLLGRLADIAERLDG